jgi:hypothetical protein
MRRSVRLARVAAAMTHVHTCVQIQLAKRDELIQNLREELAAYRIADQAVDTRTRNENKIKIYDSERSILPLSPPGLLLSV